MLILIGHFKSRNEDIVMSDSSLNTYRKLILSADQLKPCQASGRVLELHCLTSLECTELRAEELSKLEDNENYVLGYN